MPIAVLQNVSLPMQRQLKRMSCSPSTNRHHLSNDKTMNHANWTFSQSPRWLDLRRRADKKRDSFALLGFEMWFATVRVSSPELCILLCTIDCRNRLAWIYRSVSYCRFERFARFLVKEKTKYEQSSSHKWKENNTYQTPRELYWLREFAAAPMSIHHTWPSTDIEERISLFLFCQRQILPKSHTIDFDRCRVSFCMPPRPMRTHVVRVCQVFVHGISSHIPMTNTKCESEWDQRIRTSQARWIHAMRKWGISERKRCRKMCVNSEQKIIIGANRYAKRFLLRQLHCDKASPIGRAKHDFLCAKDTHRCVAFDLFVWVYSDQYRSGVRLFIVFNCTITRYFI